MYKMLLRRVLLILSGAEHGGPSNAMQTLHFMYAAVTNETFYGLVARTVQYTDTYVRLDQSSYVIPPNWHLAIL